MLAIAAQEIHRAATRIWSVLAVPEARVAARSIPCSRSASIEM
jgi:hypothetical protein